MTPDRHILEGRALIVSDENRLLLLKHRYSEISEISEKWDIPGQNTLTYESTQDAAKTGVRNQVGIGSTQWQHEKWPFAGGYEYEINARDYCVHTSIDVFLRHNTDGEYVWIHPQEFLALGWFTRDEIKDLPLTPGLQEFISRLDSRWRLPEVEDFVEAEDFDFDEPDSLDVLER